MGKLTKCLREPDFRALYNARGDKDTQDAIRKANPEVKHCQWLKDATGACDELPVSIGSEYAGCVCPNNPYWKYKEQHDELGEYGRFLEEAFYIGDLVSLGQLGPPERISPEDYQIARVMWQHQRAEEFRLRAEMMGGSTDDDGE